MNELSPDLLSNLPWYLKLALSLGGAALLWRLFKDGAKRGTKAAVKYILKRFPLVRAFAKAHAKDIDDLINEVEAGVEEAIAEAVEEDKPKDPEP
jgi:hypothetical protein